MAKFKSERPAADPIEVPGQPAADGPTVPAPADPNALPAQMTPEAPEGSTLVGRTAFQPAEGEGDKPAFQPTAEGAPRTAFAPPDRPGMPFGYSDPGPIVGPLGVQDPAKPPAVLTPADNTEAGALVALAGQATGLGPKPAEGSREAYRAELAELEARDKSRPEFPGVRYWELHYLANGLTPPER